MGAARAGRGRRWGWVPGSAAAAVATSQPVYAPALVGFYGTPGAVSWSPAAGAPLVVGWYPLAPGEVYWPAYAVSVGYVRVPNAASVVVSGQIRALPEPNAPAPAHLYAKTLFAATAVPEEVFPGMQAVAPSQVALAPAALAQAPLSARDPSRRRGRRRRMSAGRTPSSGSGRSSR